MSVVQVKALKRVKYGRHQHEIGDTFDCLSDIADGLARGGVVEIVKPAGVSKLRRALSPTPAVPKEKEKKGGGK
jgi:hypothetical protein